MLPGFIAIWALALAWPQLPLGLTIGSAQQPTFSQGLYTVLSSLGTGLVVSALRWLLIDSLLHWTGLAAPQADFTLLHERMDAFLLAVEHNYRYYQFYANLLVSLLILAVASMRPGRSWSWEEYALLAALELLLLVTARDSLRRYYMRLGQILRKVEETSRIVRN